MTETLSQYSAILLYCTMVVYAAAFVAFAIDLAQRSAAAGRPVAQSGAGEQLTAAQRRAAAQMTQTASGGSGRSGTVTTLDRPTVIDDDAEIARTRSGGVVIRVAMALTWLGFVAHLLATILRGVAAERVPWANMWEFSMTGTVLMVGVFLGVQFKFDLRFLGAFLIGLVLMLLGIASLQYYVDVVPLPPALQSYWLVIHVLVATLATGFFALGFALSGVQLMRTRYEESEDSPPTWLRFLKTLPAAVTLENLAYRLNVIGFILWTFTLIAGSIWAEAAWGRYWGWDTKEVWTFIIWVIYAGYIHARATRGWRGSRSAWLAIVGFSAVMFNFGIVNVFFKGLHAYSGL